MTFLLFETVRVVPPLTVVLKNIIESIKIHYGRITIVFLPVYFFLQTILNLDSDYNI